MAELRRSACPDPTVTANPAVEALRQAARLRRAVTTLVLADAADAAPALALPTAPEAA